MKHLNLIAGGLALTVLGGVMTGCVDDNYNISDANSLTRILVNDLTIPLNLDKICIEDVVDLTDGTNVELVTDANGQEYYAFVEKGDVNSDPIEIDPIDVDRAVIENSTAPIPGTSGSYNLINMTSEFVYSAANIDSSVKHINELQATEDIEISLDLVIPSSVSATSTKLENVRLEFPKGLMMADGTAGKANIGTYDPKTGYVNITSYNFTDPHRAVITVKSECIEFEDSEVTISTDRVMTFTGDMGISGQGKIILTGSSLPSSLDLTAEYDLPAFGVRTFSGEVDYMVENTEIEPIHFDDLPDFFQDPQTKILMANPQFYFAVENPTYKYGTKGLGHLRMDSYFRNIPDYGSESPEFEIGKTTVSHICLSPSGNVTDPLPEFKEGLRQWPYPEMEYILSGDPSSEADGLPTEINVEFANPRLTGEAKRFPVLNAKHNEPIGSMTGHYEFFAPLAFEEGTVVVYSEKSDIGGDDTKDLYVEYLTVKADGISSFPVDVTLSAVAYNINGEKLGSSNNLVIPALSQMPVTLVIEAEEELGTMRGIDSLDFRAIVMQKETGSGEALEPEQGLELNNLKITVSGYYEKKF